MANLLEGSDWVAGIYQLETDDPVLGGEEGIDNLQAKQLASRTQFLKNAVEERITTADAVELLEPKASWAALDPVIEAGGLTPDHTVPTQLRDAIKNIVKGPADKIVRVASTAAINLAAPGANIDGTAMVIGETFLEKDNATLVNRGIYVWNGAAVPATRDPAADTGAELFGGMIIRAKEGTVNADTNWQITNDGVVTVGVTGLTFKQVGASEVVTAASDPTFVDDSAIAASTSWIRGAMSKMAIAAGFSYSFTPSGFLKFPDWFMGFIIQWHINSGPGSTVSGTATFPLAFPNQVFGIHLTQFNAGTLNSAPAVTSKTLTTYGWHRNGTASSSLFMIAAGN